MIKDTSITFLLEESAGTQDTNLIGSTLFLYLHHFVKEDVKELILVLDNCRSVIVVSWFVCCHNTSLLLYFILLTSSSVNKSYKLLAFCQLLVDAGKFERIHLYFLFENHAKGQCFCFVLF